MRVRADRVALAALVLITSCSNGPGTDSQSDTSVVKRPSETSIVKRPIAAAPTTVSKGGDCNERKLREYWTKSPYQSLSKNPKPEELRLILMGERRRIRSLDLLTLKQEQKELVDSMEEMIIEITQAVTNQRRSGSYDAAILRWGDAEEDFRRAYVRECKGL